MASKRAGTPSGVSAKRSKTGPEAPLLNFIGKCQDVPQPARDMLKVAVPFCLEVVDADRHKFQTEILSRLSSLLAGVESTKRATLSENEASLKTIEGEKEKASADSAAKKATADTKKEECDKKNAVVDEAHDVLKGVEAVLKNRQEAQGAFNTKKESLISERESFDELMTKTYEPLKANSFAGNWRERNKVVANLQKKLSELGAQESLSDALATTLKMNAEKREGTFAKATLQFAQDYFDKHKAKVASDIASLDSEEATHASAITSAEAEVAERKAASDALDKEFDELQNVWIGLEKISAEAAREEKKVDAQIPRAQKAIDRSKADLEKFLELPALLATLKEKSTVAEEEAAAEEPAEEAAAEEPAAAENA